MDEVFFFSDRSSSSSVTTMLDAPLPSLPDPSTRRFVLAWKLMSKLVDAIEGPPEKLSRRLAVLSDIDEAWGSNRDVVVVIQDSRHSSVSRCDINDVREDLCNQRPQLRLDKINIEAAPTSDETLLQAGNDVVNDAVEDGSVAWSDLSTEMGDDSPFDLTRDSPGDPTCDLEEQSAVDEGRGGLEQPPWSEEGANNQQSTSQTRTSDVEDRPRHYCKKCDQDFHLGEFSSDRPFACPRCEPSPTKPRPLQTAARSDEAPADATTGFNVTSKTSRRPFPCRMCPKRFIRKSHLEEHIRRHNNEKPFFCVCGKAFCTKGGLNSHKKTHFRVKTTRHFGRASNTRWGRSPRLSRGAQFSFESPKVKKPNMIEQVGEEAQQQTHVYLPN